jgi:hypothetical protein
MDPVIFTASFTFILSNFIILIHCVFFVALEAWRLVLAALASWTFAAVNLASFKFFNSLKNFSQLARYDAGSCSCGVMK